MDNERIPTFLIPKGNDMRKLQIEYSGWIHCDAKDIEFWCVGRRDLPKTINGEQWLDLDEDDQGEYVLESLSAARNEAFDGQEEQLDITETVD